MKRYRRETPIFFLLLSISTQNDRQEMYSTKLTILGRLFQVEKEEEVQEEGRF